MISPPGGAYHFAPYFWLKASRNTSVFDVYVGSAVWSCPASASVSGSAGSIIVGVTAVAVPAVVQRFIWNSMLLSAGADSLPMLQ